MPTLTTSQSVKLLWILAHGGAPRNELAGATIEEASHFHPLNPKSPPLQISITSCRKKQQKNWKMFCENLCTNKLRTIKPTLNLWKSDGPVSCKLEVAALRLQFGHTLSMHTYILNCQP